MSKRGRKPKFKVNDCVTWVEDGVAPDGSPVQYLREGVVVEWRKYRTNNFYYVVPIDGQSIAGRKRKFESYQLTASSRKAKSKDFSIHVPLNDGIIERGCHCQCCAHTRIPRRFFKDYRN